jgi:hypothetical protein
VVAPYPLGICWDGNVRKKVKMSIVHWEVGNLKGNGMPVVDWVAEAWVKGQNKKWGTGSHWAVPCNTSGSVVQLKHKERKDVE